MTYALHPEATKELAEALAFYREQGGIELARAFLAEFERVATLLISNPGFGTPTTGGRRSFPLRRFPYSLSIEALVKTSVFLLLGINTGALAIGQAGSKVWWVNFEDANENGQTDRAKARSDPAVGRAQPGWSVAGTKMHIPKVCPALTPG